jgi:deazaflavin-dependent oxidoreductase (nitroreductase family)
MFLHADPKETAAADRHGGSSGHYVAERKHNLFVNKAAWGRVLSASQLPWFTLRPPAGFGVLTMTGRKTGKTRRKCIRAIRAGNKAYIVSIRPTAWLRNVQANPSVRLRVQGGTFSGVVRELRGAAETREARDAYCETVNAFDFIENMMWRRGRPTRTKVEQLHRDWFERGTPLVVELED